MEDIFDRFLEQFGIDVEVIDGCGRSGGIHKALRTGDSTRFCFPSDINSALDQRGQIRMQSTGDTYDVSHIDKGNREGEFTYYIVHIKDNPSPISQSINITGSSIGQLNYAGRDVHVSNRDIFGPETVSTDQLLSEIHRIAESDTSLTVEEKADALRNSDIVKQELAQPKPKAEQILQALGHLSSITAIAGIAQKLGELLAVKLLP